MPMMVSEFSIFEKSRTPLQAQYPEYLQIIALEELMQIHNNNNNNYALSH